MKNKNSTLTQVYVMNIGVHIFNLISDIVPSFLLRYISLRDPSKEFSFKTMFLVEKNFLKN